MQRFCSFLGVSQGVQSDNGSMVYYLPGYNPYAPGTLMGVDGQGVGQQQYFSSSGYIQPPVSYGSEAMPCYSWDTAFSGDISTATNSGFGNRKSGPGSTALSRSSGFMSGKTNGDLSSKFSKTFPPSQPIKSLNKVCKSRINQLCFDSMLCQHNVLAHMLSVAKSRNEIVARKLSFVLL